MTFTFRYRNDPSFADLHCLPSPRIPVWVHSAKGKPVEVIALVDSGADMTIVPHDLAVFLGISAKGHERATGGIGGAATVKDATSDMLIKDAHNRHPFSIPVLVLQDKDSRVPLILGRKGFFEEFDVMISQRKRVVTLKS